MYLRQSDSAASLQLSNQRKRDLVEHFEANGDELDRWRKFNAAYHEDDFKFMKFLIPPGKRVLELGCGRGDLLAALGLRSVRVEGSDGGQDFLEDSVAGMAVYFHHVLSSVAMRTVHGRQQDLIH